MGRSKAGAKNADGPKVKTMLAGRSGQMKAAKKAKKISPGSEQDWMTLQSLQCPVCPKLFKVGKRNTRKRCLITHLKQRHVDYCKANNIVVEAGKLADALKHDEGKVLTSLMCGTSLGGGNAGGEGTAMAIDGGGGVGGVGGRGGGAP